MAEGPDISPILNLLEDARDAGRCAEAAAALRVLSQLRPENLQVKAAWRAPYLALASGRKPGTLTKCASI